MTAPFLLPYGALRGQGFAERSLNEVFRFSADVYWSALRRASNNSGAR